jgi:hypothetical protein
MKTILSIALLLAGTQALAAGNCSIKAYAKGKLIRDANPVLFKNDISCAATANSIINGSFGLEEGKADAVEFSYLSEAGETIKGAIYK